MSDNVLGLPPVTPSSDRKAPIGTVDELAALNMDLAEYPSCARPNKAGGIRGCPLFHACRVSAKGKSGPRNYGVRIVKGNKQGGGFVATEVDCMWIAERAEHYEANGGAVRVIAEEGEEFDKITSVNVEGDAPSFSGGRSVNADYKRDLRRVPVKVKPFPRPNQNVAILQDVMRAEMAQEEKDRRADDGLARSLGLESTIPPIDRREDKRRKKDGGTES